MQKLCTKCNVSKSIEEFRKRSSSKDGLSPHCKPCLDVVTEAWRQRNRDKRNTQIKQRYQTMWERLNAYKSELGCACCPERSAVCLDLHHVDPSQKEADPSRFVGCSWERLMAEAEKCIVVCSNCHKKIHAGHITRDRSGNKVLK